MEVAQHHNTDKLGLEAFVTNCVLFELPLLFLIIFFTTLFLNTHFTSLLNAVSLALFQPKSFR